MVRKRKELNFDDTIQCRFYSRKKYSLSEWEDLCKDLNITISELSKGYLWNRDEFKVNIPLQLEDKTKIDHLITLTCFGENIEDEWFIVHLVYELTRLYDDLIVHVEDGDGCFLLIEAANYLPHWLNPDNADNRVFIYQNCIHLIDPDLVSLEDDLDISSAINILIDNCDKTKASNAIQTAIQNRINGYPEKIKNTIHTAIVSLPIDIAAILKLKPSLISSIINTYCNHDMFEAKICQDVKYKDCIDVSITFTKFLYAMLIHASHKRSFDKQNLQTKEKKEVLGYKLTCGYEIIMKQSTQDIFVSSEYKKFLNGLTKLGYFKNNIQGSQEYNKLLEKAKTNFLSMECPINKHIYNEISTMKTEESFFNLRQQFAQGCNSELVEDDDSWLNISPEQLDDVLTSRFGANSAVKDKSHHSAQNIAAALTNFLKKNSDFDGIEKTVESPEEDQNKIELDPEEFAKCIDKYLNIVTSNDPLELNSDSEYSDIEDDASREIDHDICSALSYFPKPDHHTVKNNLIQSIKEEGISGPSSNILKTIGINKTNLLDSDDDE